MCFLIIREKKIILANGIWGHLASSRAINAVWLRQFTTLGTPLYLKIYFFKATRVDMSMDSNFYFKN